MPPKKNAQEQSQSPSPKPKQQSSQSVAPPSSSSSSSSSSSAAGKQKSSKKKNGGGFLGTVFIVSMLALFVALFVALDNYKEKHYIFDPKVLHSIAQGAIAKNLPTEQLFETIIRDLEKHYPGHVNQEKVWIFNNAGGAMGAMLLIHCSLTEYIIIFGTPVGTEGHTGRFLVDDYFIILQGEQWAFSEGSLEREVYKPGEMHHLPRGDARQYRMPDKCWALEYARGWIPLMLPFGVADTLTSTLDHQTLLRTFWWYGKLVTKELLLGKI